MKTQTNHILLRTLLILSLAPYTDQSAGSQRAEEEMKPVFAERIPGTSAWLADIGTVDFEKDDLRFRIGWRNDTGTPLTIRNVRSLCQCASVKASTHRIDRNETCYFDMTWALEDKYGAFGTGFMLEMDELKDPLLIQLALRRPAPPRLIPESGADFGLVQTGTEVDRVILVRAFDSEHNTVLEPTRSITCDLPFVSGEVVEQTNNPFRSPNTSMISHRCQLRVRLRCSPDVSTPPGAFSGTVLIPIEYQSSALEMIVPVSGRIRGRVGCRPDRIVLFGRRNAAVTREFRVYSDEAPRPKILHAVCSEPQVSLTVVQASHEDDTGCIGRVQFTIQSLESLRGEFRLSIATNNRASELTVPLESFILENGLRSLRGRTEH